MPSMSRDKPPFRADHVGSLLRPKKLADARAAWKNGKLPDAKLTAIEDDCIRDAIAMQEAAGLKGVTDGEFRRDYWHLDFMWGFGGVVPTETEYAAPFSHETKFLAPAAKVVGKVRFPAGGIMRDHFEFLKSATRQTAKITIPAPTTFRNRHGREIVTEEAYPDWDEFWSDLGTGYNAAVKDFGALGCEYLQLDDVNSCLLCDDAYRKGVAAQGQDPGELLDRYISVNNAATAGRPAGMAITTHMCRGNFKSEYMTGGAYDAIAEKVLAQVDVDGFFMEYDDARSGGFEPLRFLPKGKFAVLGIVTSKRAELESKDDLIRRLEDAAKYAPMDQLCLSPQCGFASTHHGNRLTEDDQRRKLERIVEVAEAVWGGV